MLEQDVLLDLLARKDNRAYQYLYQCYYVALKALVIQTKILSQLDFLLY